MGRLKKQDSKKGYRSDYFCFILSCTFSSSPPFPLSNRPCALLRRHLGPALPRRPFSTRPCLILAPERTHTTATSWFDDAMRRHSSAPRVTHEHPPELRVYTSLRELRRRASIVSLHCGKKRNERRVGR